MRAWKTKLIISYFRLPIPEPLGNLRYICNVVSKAVLANSDEANAKN